MLDRRRWRHVLGLLSAVLQFALPIGVTYADARLGADSRRAQPHVESDRTSNCRPVHSPECGLCRFLANPSAAGIVAASVVDMQHGARAALPRALGFPRVAGRELPRSRGPPQV
jgi:hypothetical protein